MPQPLEGVADGISSEQRQLQCSLITNQLPIPSFGGGHIRVAATLASLRTFSEVAVTFVGNCTDSDRERAEIFCIQVGATLTALSPQPQSSSYFQKRILLLVRSLSSFLEELLCVEPPTRILEAVEESDVVWIHSTSIFERYHMPSPKRVILDINDLNENQVSPGMSLGRRLVRRATMISRSRQMQGSIVSLVCSSLDAKRLHEKSRIEVLPNTYLTAEDIRQSQPSTQLQVPRVTPRRPTVLLVAKLTYQPNLDSALWFLTNVWPIIESFGIQCQLHIVGRGGHEFLKDFRSPLVRMYGEVEDVSKFLAQATLTIAPIQYGSGTRVKILEAFAHQLPVVSTTVGAEGLGAVHEEHLLIADSPSEFAAAILRLIKNPTDARILAKNALALYQEEFSFAGFRDRVANITFQALNNW